MICEVPNSHYWSDLEMMINYFKVVPDIDREYILVGLKNMQANGYKVVKGRPQKKTPKKAGHITHGKGE